jgi:hypothetical protein
LFFLFLVQLPKDGKGSSKGGKGSSKGGNGSPKLPKLPKVGAKETVPHHTGSNELKNIISSLMLSFVDVSSSLTAALFFHIQLPKDGKGSSKDGKGSSKDGKGSPKLPKLPKLPKVSGETLDCDSIHSKSKNLSCDASIFTHCCSFLSSISSPRKVKVLQRMGRVLLRVERDHPSSLR